MGEMMAQQPGGKVEKDTAHEQEALSADDSENLPSLNEQSDDDGGNFFELDGDLASFNSKENTYMVIARNGLNLRSGPGVEFSRIGSIPFGTRVQVLKRKEDWGLVDQQGDGAADGFAHMTFLEQSADQPTSLGDTLAKEDVRAFWAKRNPRGAKLYDGSGNPLVDPKLLHASALGLVNFEASNLKHRVELYGPGAGFRTSGSIANHGAQPGTGRGAALDFVIIDRGTGKMLTNHPGANHQRQGKVGENAPLYQLLFNEVVRAGSQIYPSFAEMARFGGYFASGANAMDTMHVDMRGQVVKTAGGNLKEGFKESQMKKWKVPNNHPYR